MKRHSPKCSHALHAIFLHIGGLYAQVDKELRKRGTTGTNNNQQSEGTITSPGFHNHSWHSGVLIIFHVLFM